MDSYFTVALSLDTPQSSQRRQLEEPPSKILKVQKITFYTKNLLRAKVARYPE